MLLRTPSRPEPSWWRCWVSRYFGGQHPKWYPRVMTNNFAIEAMAIYRNSWNFPIKKWWFSSSLCYINVSLPEGRWKILIQADHSILVELDDWMIHHFSTTGDPWDDRAEKNTLVPIFHHPISWVSTNSLFLGLAAWKISGERARRTKIEERATFSDCHKIWCQCPAQSGSWDCGTIKES